MWYFSTELALLLIKKKPQNTLKYQVSLVSMSNISSTRNNETDPQYIYLCTQSTWHFNFSFNSKQTILVILYPEEKQWNSCTSWVSLFWYYNILKGKYGNWNDDNFSLLHDKTVFWNNMPLYKNNISSNYICILNKWVNSF